jgi:DNA-directed RNA polymerase subunit RPC12/RpoP
MTETNFVCSVCDATFSEHRAQVNPVDVEDEVRCPECGSTQVEVYHFDPDAPVPELADVSEEEI